MKVQKNDLAKSQVELVVELEYNELTPYLERAAEKISKEIKIEGFRPGKAPLDIIKQKVGEAAILEDAARIAINKTLDAVIRENIVDRQPVGHPQINITIFAPGNPMEYKIVIALIPGMQIGDYKTAKAKREPVEIKDEEVEKMIAELREVRVKEVLVDREVKENDKVLINIDVYLEKVPVEGGQGKGVAIMMGKDYVVPGFDKQLVGMKKGETREFSLPYPADHHQKNLAGKMVEFKITVLDVYERELPELNDEFAAAFGLKKVDELKENIKKSIEEERKQQAEQKLEMTIIEKIVEASTFEEIPDALIENETQAILSDMEQEVTRQGGKFDDYLASMKKSKEELALDVLPNAIKRVKAALVIREISVKEDMKVSDEEIDKKVEELIAQYKGYEKVEARVKAPEYRSYLYSTLINKKVVEKLREWNIE